MIAALATVKFLVVVLTTWAVLFGVVVLPGILIGFRKLDNWIYAYYLMQDYAFSTQQRGGYPKALGTRIKGFQAQIAHGLKNDVDEVLVICLAPICGFGLVDFLRETDAVQNAPVLNFLSLRQVILECLFNRCRSIVGGFRILIIIRLAGISGCDRLG